ncbi:hypothetical protein ACU4GD_28730 [Cupriavidus basilensis]
MPNDRRDPFTDGARGGVSAALELAGRDLSGVSASPAHDAAANSQASASIPRGRSGPWVPSPGAGRQVSRSPIAIPVSRQTMKTIVLALLSVTALASSLPALAGPDWTVIERARPEAGASEAARRRPPAR